MTHPELPVKESLFRGARVPAAEPVQVSRNGGDNGAGILSGVSLIAAGEALGHDMWIDDVTLSQVAEQAGQGKHGIKSRFTHPSMSADGMGRHLGRIKDVRVEGDRVLGDLHFAKSAHSTPDGNLAEYVMELAEEDPAAAGLSIVFEHDAEREEAYQASFGDGPFESPDEDNVKNLPHVRLAKLRAADVVDEPAANPEGMFDRQPLARDVDDLLSYAAGLSEEKPKSLAFGVDADRASQFLQRWLGSHSLSIVSANDEESQMSDLPEVVESDVSDVPQITREDFLSELSAYVDKFGAENGQQWFSEGIDLSEALGRQCDVLNARVEELQGELAAAKDQLSAAASIGEDPIDVGDASPVSDKARFADFFKDQSN
ncbi:hypothetical protein N8510_01180 [bacterium]|nr:hypothetical protein [bacterium]